LPRKFGLLNEGNSFTIKTDEGEIHIKILNNAGFISIQNIGRERYGILKQDGFNELQEWMAYFDNFWVSKLKKLETLLNKKASDKQ